MAVISSAETLLTLVQEQELEPEREPDPELELELELDSFDTQVVDSGDANTTFIELPANASPRDRACVRLGKTFAGRYKLLDVIGAGAGGAVYEAFDRFESRLCAVKLLHAGLRAEPDHVARFLREARMALRIRHPAIVRVLDAGSDGDGALYQVLELLDGEPLETAIARRALDDDGIVDVGLQLLDALRAVHEARIVHRDIKPQNVFLAHDRLKLIDFGIAESLSFDGPFGPTTAPKSPIGTPHYMSPEQCRGEPLDARVDLWATGAVLYHAFTGAPPFADRTGLVGDDTARVVARVIHQRPASLEELRPDLPRSIITVVDRALARRIDARWPSAESMWAALAAAQQ